MMPYLLFYIIYEHLNGRSSGMSCPCFFEPNLGMLLYQSFAFNRSVLPWHNTFVLSLHSTKRKMKTLLATH